MPNLEIYVMMAVLAVPAIGIVWIWRRLQAPREKRRNDEYSSEFFARLRSPNFNPIEAHFCVVLPSSLKGFYASDYVTEGCDLTVNNEEWSIAFFEPLDGDSLRESWPGCERFVSIANDGCGNEYVFDPKEDTAPIRFYDHETGELTDVAVTLDEFLDLIRSAIKTNQSEQVGGGNRLKPVPHL